MIDQIEKEIQELLDSDVTSYRIREETGIAQQVIDRYRKGESKIENMSLKNARKLIEFKERGERKMKTKKVIDVYGREVEINTENQKLHSFDNKKGEIEYNAQIVEDGKLTQFWTDYKVPGKVESVEEALQSFGNIVRAAYAATVNYDRTKNDPDNKIWEKFVNHVESNRDEFFTKDGNWRKRIAVDTKNKILVIKDNN